MGIPSFNTDSGKVGVAKICTCAGDLYRVRVSIFCFSRSGWLVVEDGCIFAVWELKLGLLESCHTFAGASLLVDGSRKLFVVKARSLVFSSFLFHGRRQGVGLKA